MNQCHGFTSIKYILQFDNNIKLFNVKNNTKLKLKLHNIA